MRDIKELKIAKGGRSTVASLAELDKLEEKIGAALPASYRHFISEANGGHPELDTFYGSEGSQWGVNNFFFAGDDSSVESLVWNYDNRPFDSSSKFLPIARGGGGDLFCLDLVSGQIVIWLHDTQGDSVRLVAENFEAFIDGLKENPDYI